jgi:hypothetical protein
MLAFCLAHIFTYSKYFNNIIQNSLTYFIGITSKSSKILLDPNSIPAPNNLHAHVHFAVFFFFFFLGKYVLAP